jgi:pimeloyl-ACP methyl ester carboxylesterase
MRRHLLLGLGTAIVSAAFAAGTLRRRYRRDIDRIEAELAAASQIADTSAGRIEFGSHGGGEKVLVVHGAGGGFDQGLALGDSLFGPGYKVIAHSRFGYLGTASPGKSTPADQADVHAALLAALAIDQAIVVGVPAGAPSAIEMALRHPDRVPALILVVPRAYAPGIAPVSAPPEATGLIRQVMSGADFAFWTMIRLARKKVVRFLGVPPAVEAGASEKERARVTAIMEHILPLSRRIDGLRNDALAEIREWPLGRITAPTLVVSAEDDLYRSLLPARHIAEGIAGAELVVLASGGHLLVGRGEEVRAAIDAFVDRASRQAIAA